LTPAVEAIRQVRETQEKRKKPLAIVLAGHNGSGKSTFWRRNLADELRMPLVNADRMMLAILPEQASDGALPDWAATLRDTDQSWMKVSQQGVQAFVGHAMNARVPFAMETVTGNLVTTVLSSQRSTKSARCRRQGISFCSSSWA
jgi:predicted ABC-type ATPase